MVTCHCNFRGLLDVFPLNMSCAVHHSETMLLRSISASLIPACLRLRLSSFRDNVASASRRRNHGANASQETRSYRDESGVHVGQREAPMDLLRMPNCARGSGRSEWLAVGPGHSSLCSEASTMIAITRWDFRIASNPQTRSRLGKTFGNSSISSIFIHISL
jgi:hypothetical protein